MTSYTKYERLNNKLDNILKAHETLLNMISNLENKVSKCPSQCICCPPVQESKVEATTFSTPKVVQPKPKLQQKRKPAAKTFTGNKNHTINKSWPAQHMRRSPANYTMANKATFGAGIKHQRASITARVTTRRANVNFKPKTGTLAKTGGRATARRKQPVVPQKAKPKPMVIKKPATAKKSAVNRKSAPSSVKKSVTAKKPVVKKSVVKKPVVKKPVVKKPVVKKPVVSKKVNSRMTRVKRTSTTKKPAATSSSSVSKGKPKSQPPASNMKAKVHVPNNKSKPKSLQRTKTKGLKSANSQRTTKQQPRNSKGQSKISPSEKKPNTRPSSASSPHSSPVPSPKRRRVDDSFDLFTMPKESDFDGPPVKGARFGGIGLPKRRRKSIFP